MKTTASRVVSSWFRWPPCNLVPIPPSQKCKRSHPGAWGPDFKSNSRAWGRQRTHIPILCHFPTPSIGRIYYFETLTFRDSIDVYYKSTFVIYLMSRMYQQKL